MGMLNKICAIVYLFFLFAPVVHLSGIDLGTKYELSFLSSGAVLEVDGGGGSDFESIQSAIDSADPGDIIHVHEGIYREKLVIDKSLTLKGDGACCTVIDGFDAGNVVEITANHVQIDGFNISTSSQDVNCIGVDIKGDHIWVENCTFYKNQNSINMDNCDNCRVVNNTFFSLKNNAIKLDSSSSNLIGDNLFTISYSPLLNLTDVLYDGSLGGTPDTQGFFYIENPPITADATQTFQDNSTILDTMPTKTDSAGYFNEPDLMHNFNRSLGYSLKFRVQVLDSDYQGSDRNGDGLDDRSGFSVILIGDDLKGIELSLWDDEIWVQEDGSDIPPAGDLFTHAEGVYFDTTNGPNFYELKMYQENYSLRAEGVEILKGRLRDYSDFVGPADPYEIKNLIFLGDDTASARGRTLISHVSITTCVIMDMLSDDSGILLRHSDGNVIENNRFENDTGVALFLHLSGNNVVRENTFLEGRDPAIDISDFSSRNNRIFYNIFLNNNYSLNQALDDGINNLWDDGMNRGNFWSDYRAKYADADNDGVVWDIPYSIEGECGSSDNFPLVRSPLEIDNTPPWLLSNNCDLTGTTGDLYTFNITASDDVGVEKVEVSWRHSGAGGNELLEIQENIWRGIVELSDSIENLYYTIHIHDLSGNENVLPERSVQVLDNDSPGLEKDMSMELGSTGDEFQFNITVFDNVGVDSVHVNWSHEYSGGNVSLGKGFSSWILTILLDHSVTELCYTIDIRDEAGNHNISSPITKRVLDNDEPTASAGDDIIIYQGEHVFLDAEGSNDNIGIVNYSWSILRDGHDHEILFGEQQEYVFQKQGNYTVDLSVRDAQGNVGWDQILVNVSAIYTDKANDTNTSGDDVLEDQNNTDEADEHDTEYDNYSEVEVPDIKEPRNDEVSPAPDQVKRGDDWIFGQILLWVSGVIIIFIIIISAIKGVLVLVSRSNKSKKEDDDKP